MQNWVNYIFLLIFVAGLFLFVLIDRRGMNLIAFSGIMLLGFVINIQFWPFTFALAKLLTGLMAILILYLTPADRAESLFGSSRTGKVFRGVALGLGLIIILFIAPRSTEFLSIPLEQFLASMFMVVAGIIQIGISQNPYREFLGIITLFLGFEIIYGSVERSLLINGMLAAVDLLLAFIGSYLITNGVEGGKE